MVEEYCTRLIVIFIIPKYLFFLYFLYFLITWKFVKRNALVYPVTAEISLFIFWVYEGTLIFFF